MLCSWKSVLIPLLLTGFVVANSTEDDYDDYEKLNNLVRMEEEEQTTSETTEQPEPETTTRKCDKLDLDLEKNILEDKLKSLLNATPEQMVQLEAALNESFIKLSDQIHCTYLKKLVTESPITAIPKITTTTTTTTTTTPAPTTTTTTTPAPTTPPSTTRSTTTTTTVAPIVQCGEDNENRCVAFWKCKSSRTLNDKYEIDITTRDECHYLETCCPDAEISNASRRLIKSVPPSCGYGTNNGVIMTIKGKRASESNFGEYPWTVGVFDMEDKYLFGGSLISIKVVLTSASELNSKHRKVRAGEWDMKTNKEALSYEERFVKETVIHHKFVFDVYANDVALLILEKPFKLLPHIRPICLASNNELNRKECIVTGWNDYTWTDESIMRAMKLQLTQCNSFVHETLLCVTGKNSDLTYGNGSPLVCPEQGSTNRYYQIGIWSHGISTNGTKFTDVQRQYEWIRTELATRNISIS
ncbi:phenoloxidase-activating factor 2-like isoform X1 [Drosophila albomicans]|uniref:Phenoloxidase-activating factor 2-like isoform X1 n=1 Tax=Drosophila albomicans TaxID=7291 RepID=A0A9C6SKY4_DROAB|nr:phenoloxidase-activating factor 2-like isoform X1 [Drosophila albomicans]